MQPLALKGSSRLWLTRLHRWSGFVIMAFVLVAALTGMWLVFRPELERTLQPQLRTVIPAVRQVPTDELVTQVERAYPTSYVSLFQFARRPDDSISLQLSPRRAGDEERVTRVYLNPYTGQILGTQGAAEGLTLSSLNSWILSLHDELLASSWGSRIMGIVALTWLLTNLAGLALAWPRLWNQMRSWIPILSLRSGNAYLLNYDLHRAGGVWLLPVLTVLAFTAVSLNLPQLVRPVVEAFSPLSRQPPGARVSPGESRTSFGQADEAVRHRFPEARTNNIYRDFAHGRDSVYFHLPHDANPQGDNFALVDLKSGEITALRLPARSSRGERFMAWLYPLHTGTALGWPGRMLIALAGITLIVQNSSALYTWFVRWRKRRTNRRQGNTARPESITAQQRG